MAWRPIEEIPNELKDGRELILAMKGDDFSWSGYWEKQPNYWDEIGWHEEDARQGHFYHRHPSHPDRYMELPAPPNGDQER